MPYLFCFSMSFFLFFSFCKNEVWNSAASSCRCGSPPLVNLCTSQDLVFFKGYICAVVSYWHAFTYYREAADDPNSRASSQAPRKDKEAGGSNQFFSRWQFKEHKRREKEKVMAVSFCVFFFLLFVLILSVCGSCLSEAWKSLWVLVGFWSIWKFMYPSFMLSSDSEVHLTWGSCLIELWLILRRFFISQIPLHSKL